jgi:hypothetical protein
MGFDYADIHYMQHSSQQARQKQQRSMAEKNSELAAFREASAALSSSDAASAPAAPMVAVSAKALDAAPPVAAKLKRRLKSEVADKKKKTSAIAKEGRKKAGPLESSAADGPKNSDPAGNTNEAEEPSLLGSLVAYSSDEDE